MAAFWTVQVLINFRSFPKYANELARLQQERLLVTCLSPNVHSCALQRNRVRRPFVYRENSLNDPTKGRPSTDSVRSP